MALPPVVFEPDTGGGLVDPILSGTAEPGAEIRVQVQSDVVLSAASASAAVAEPDATADADGNWSLTYSGLPAGTHLLTVTQTDLAGNDSVPGIPVEVSLSSPQLVLEGIGRYVWRISFDGAPGATVQVLVDGAEYSRVVLDAEGDYTVRGLFDIPRDIMVTVRYTADERYGPTAVAERWWWADEASAPASLAG